MSGEYIFRVNALAFDILGTVLDLSGSPAPPVEEFLVQHEAEIDLSLTMTRTCVAEWIKIICDLPAYHANSGLLNRQSWK